VVPAALLLCCQPLSLLRSGLFLDRLLRPLLHTILPPLLRLVMPLLHVLVVLRLSSSAESGRVGMFVVRSCYPRSRRSCPEADSG
jgi:hypothetical protein